MQIPQMCIDFCLKKAFFTAFSQKRPFLFLRAASSFLLLVIKISASFILRAVPFPIPTDLTRPPPSQNRPLDLTVSPIAVFSNPRTFFSTTAPHRSSRSIQPCPLTLHRLAKPLTLTRAHTSPNGLRCHLPDSLLHTFLSRTLRAFSVRLFSITCSATSPFGLSSIACSATSPFAFSQSRVPCFLPSSLLVLTRFLRRPNVLSQTSKHRPARKRAAAKKCDDSPVHSIKLFLTRKNTFSSPFKTTNAYSASSLFSG